MREKSHFKTNIFIIMSLALMCSDNINIYLFSIFLSPGFKNVKRNLNSVSFCGSILNINIESCENHEKCL